jgi:hypothetical protein
MDLLFLRQGRRYFVVSEPAFVYEHMALDLQLTPYYVDKASKTHFCSSRTNGALQTVDPVRMSSNQTFISLTPSTETLGRRSRSRLFDIIIIAGGDGDTIPNHQGSMGDRESYDAQTSPLVKGKRPHRPHD